MVGQALRHLGISLAAVALAWLRQQPAVTSSTLGIKQGRHERARCQLASNGN